MRRAKKSKPQSKKIPGSAEKQGTQYATPMGSIYHPRGNGSTSKTRKRAKRREEVASWGKEGKAA